MNIHSFFHVPFEGLGSIETWARARGARITSTRFYASDPLPPVNSLDWLIVMGGPMNIYEHDSYPWLIEEKRFIHAAVTAGKVVLGICLGAQLIADVLGGKVRPNAHKEIGWFPVQKTEEAIRSRMFGVFPSEVEVFHWHGDAFELPEGAIRLARSAACENQGFVHGERVVGLQFHLETTREGAEKLIEHCADDMVAGPFIQSREAILSDLARFERINRIMTRLLDGLSEVSPGSM